MNIEKNILKCAKKLKHKYLKNKNKGLCLNACNALFEFYYNKGINCSIQFGFFDEQNHAWFEFINENNDRFLVDITADQFDNNLPDIIFGKLDDIFNSFPYKYDEQ